MKPHLTDEQFARMRGIFAIFGDALVTGRQHLTLANPLPDPGDQHVFEIAVAGGADAIVTYNTRDFPLEVADDLGIEIRHPDEFLVNIIDLDPLRALKALRVARSTQESTDGGRVLPDELATREPGANGSTTVGTCWPDLIGLYSN